MITWDEVKKAKPKLIFYSANTVFWTHDPNDLDTKSGMVPLDCFGSPLFQVEPTEFMDEARIKNHSAYGKDPFATLMACHAKNIGWLRSHNDFDPRRSTYGDVAKILESNGGKQ